MKYFVKIFKYLLITIMVVIAILFIMIFIQTKQNSNKIPSIFGYKPFIILSRTMEKEIKKGDLVIVKETDIKNLKKDDIIAYRNKDNSVIIHRIYEVIEKEGTKEVITKGDKNIATDIGTVSQYNFEGKFVIKLDRLGYLLLILKEPITLAILVTITIVIGIIWISNDSKNLTENERKELEEIRKEKQKKS